MKRGLLLVVLMLSIGFNMGLLVPLFRGFDEETAVAPTEPVADVPELAPPPRGTAIEAPSAPDGAGSPAASPTEGSPGSGEVLPPAAAPPPRPPPPALREVTERLGLSGPRRTEFVRLQQRLARRVRVATVRIQQTRRELYQQMAASEPDPARIDELLRASARANAEIDRTFVETALRSRRLLDRDQEQLYLRFLARHMQASTAARNRVAAPRRPGAERRPEALRRQQRRPGRPEGR